METGQRGYLLMGQPEYLAPYERAHAQFGALRAQLRNLVSDNPAQLARLERISGVIDERVARIDLSVSQARERGPSAGMQIVGRGRGRVLMEQIRAELNEMDTAEARLFDQRISAAAAERRTLFNMMAAALVIVAHSRRDGLYSVWPLRPQLEDTTLQLRDEIRKRELSDAQLRQAQKMESIGLLTGGIAHDFNNMLQIVSGSLQLLSRRLGEGADPQVAKYVSSAIEGANRAAALTRRLLAFSRQQPLEPRATDTNRLVANLAAMLERTLGGAVDVETVLAGGLWPTFVDPPQLESAILNLTVNARDAMDGAGKITIETGNTYPRSTLRLAA